MRLSIIIGKMAADNKKGLLFFHRRKAPKILLPPGLTAMVEYDDHAMRWYDHGDSQSPWYDHGKIMAWLS